MPYQLFGWFSDYGYSIERPVRSLFWVWFVPTLVFAGVWTSGHIGADVKVLAKAAGLSFANLFPIFGLQKLWFDSNWLVGLWWPLKFLGGLQTVLSLPLLFFFGLGLRTRFRLR